MKAVASLDFTKIGPTQQALSFFANMLRKMYQNLIFIVNGHIGFGDGTSADNIDGVWVNTMTVGANVNFTVTHNLGRIPVGYIVVKQDQASVLYDGTVPPTTTQITWKASIAGTHIRVFVFILLLGLLAFRSAAQTTVNLNVTGTDAQVWKNGTWKTSIKQKSGTTGGPPFRIISGGGLLVDQSGTLDASGNATMSLPANSNIVPAQSVWAFTVCPNASFPCLTQEITVNATSPQAVNLTPPPIVVNVLLVPPPILAYTDAEIQGATQGTLYYNTTSLTYRQCNAAFGGVCTAWAGFGGSAVWSAITGIPPACTGGTFVTDIASGTCAPPFAPGTITFDVIGTGVNNSAHMTVANGATLDFDHAGGVVEASTMSFGGLTDGSTPLLGRTFNINTGSILQPFNSGGGYGKITATNGNAGTPGECVQYGTALLFGSAGFPCRNGTVTNFTAGNLSPLFNTSVATGTTTPSLTFSLISQSAHTFFAAPSGSSGVGSFRTIVASDVPASATSCGAGNYATGMTAGLTMSCTALPSPGGYTNWGFTTTVCSTTNSAGNTCTTSVPLNVTEVDTTYKVACSGGGARTGFPAIANVLKGTTAITVTIVNGEASMAQISTWSEIDCVITR